MEILKYLEKKENFSSEKLRKNNFRYIEKKEYYYISRWWWIFKQEYQKEILINHTSIWLNWDNQTIIDRIKNSKKRPLAFNLSKDDLDQLIKKRSFTYSKSLHKINCNHLSKNEVVNKVLKIYENQKNNN